MREQSSDQGVERDPDVEFVFIAEAGTLERQSLLLCESIRKFGGRYAAAKIIILQPREEKRISNEGRLRFGKLEAQIVEIPVVSPCPEYGTSYRVLACAEYEKVSRAGRVVFMDSDSVVVAEPDLELQGMDVAARPVDVKGMCTAGEGDPNDAYWRALCRICNVGYERIPEVTATVDRAKLKASYNGGLVVVKCGTGVFEKTADFFLRSIHANLIPWPDRDAPFLAGHGEVSTKGGQLWGSSQACMSLAITALGLSVRILPASQNFPLHSYFELLPGIENGSFPRLAHIHYHHVFRHSVQQNPIFAGKLDIPCECIAWLKEKAEMFA